MEQAPVSVVIPCFRCTSTLQRAVASVAAQTQLPAELILVDDASADGTRAMMRDIAAAYTPGWVQLIFLDENQGAASARNAGWALAQQQFVAFLDADDAWHPEKIRIQTRYMLDNPQVALSGHAHKMLASSASLDWPVAHSPVAYRVGQWQLLLSNRFVTPSVMVQRQIEQRFVDRQRYMEDHMLWLSVVFSGAPVVRLHTPLAAIYKRPYGQSGLSAQWWLMERGDLGNCRRLLRQQHINRWQFLALALYSTAKFVRRVLLFNVVRRWKQ